MPIARSVLGIGRGPCAFAVPSWVTAPLLQWAQISGTSAPTDLVDYSGVGLRDDGTIVEVLSALSGGHAGNNTSNAVQGLRLDTNAPAWYTRRASSNLAGYNGGVGGSAYTADGTPGPRHLYDGAIWWPSRSRYMFGGLFWGSAGDGSWDTLDGYNPATDSWDAAGTYPNRAAGGNHLENYTVIDPATGIMYSSGLDPSQAGKKLDPTTLTMSTWHSGYASGFPGPAAWDTTRGNAFIHGPATYTSPSSTRVSIQITPGGTITAIGFNSSSAFTTWTADCVNFNAASMSYDAAADCFYWYQGAEGFSGSTSGQGQRIYKITPNGTSTWDMSTLSVSGVTPAATANGSGTQNRFKFIPRWGLAIYVVPGQSVYYIRLR